MASMCSVARGSTVGGARVDLVVNVGDVAHIDDAIGAIDMAQQPEQHVEHDDWSSVADMGKVIDGRAADIHANPPMLLGLPLLPIERDEVPLVTGQRVVKL